jgi:uncharacterized protein (DUF58 family)
VAESGAWLDSQVLNRLMHLTLMARSPMEGSVSGLHKSPHRGSSVEFAEYRNYVPGDDIRRLDWRVFARTDRFFLKEYEAETNLRCYFVLDTSGSMKFGQAPGGKLSYAKRLIATLAYITAHQGDASGLICATAKSALEIPPRRNPAHLKVLFETLDNAEARGETGLIAALHDLAERVRRRALVVVVSDFFCDLEALLNCFQHLRFQKHDLAIFQLLDRAELDFQFDRPVRFVDLESSLSIVTEPSSIRDEYLRQFHLFLEQLRRGCNEFGVDYRQVVTDQDYERVLADFLVERAHLAAASP